MIASYEFELMRDDFAVFQNPMKTFIMVLSVNQHNNSGQIWCSYDGYGTPDPGWVVVCVRVCVCVRVLLSAIVIFMTL